MTGFYMTHVDFCIQSKFYDDVRVYPSSTKSIICFSVRISFDAKLGGWGEQVPSKWRAVDVYGTGKELVPKLQDIKN